MTLTHLRYAVDSMNGKRLDTADERAELVLDEFNQIVCWRLWVRLPSGRWECGPWLERTTRVAGWVRAGDGAA